MKHRRMLFFLIFALLLVSMLMFVQLVQATTVTWLAKAPMPTARTWISAAEYGGQIYVFGGLNNTTKLATVERYDPVTNTWSSRAAMPTARYATSAVTLNNKIYVIGGVNASNQIVNIVEVYDPITDSWSTAASMPTARTRLAAVTGPDGKIYAIGGSTTSTLDLTGYSSVVEVYTPGNQFLDHCRTHEYTPRGPGGGGFWRPDLCLWRLWKTPWLHSPLSAHGGSIQPGQQHLEQLSIHERCSLWAGRGQHIHRADLLNWR